MFHLGQKVVCVEQFDTPYFRNETVPVKGEVYTIRGIVPVSEFPIYVNNPGVYLEEIVNPLNLYLTWTGERLAEQCWDIMFFRPLVERKTDISIFTALLNPKIMENA